MDRRRDNTGERGHRQKKQNMKTFKILVERRIEKEFFVREVALETRSLFNANKINQARKSLSKDPSYSTSNSNRKIANPAEKYQIINIFTKKLKMSSDVFPKKSQEGQKREQKEVQKIEQIKTSKKSRLQMEAQFYNLNRNRAILVDHTQKLEDSRFIEIQLFNKYDQLLDELEDKLVICKKKVTKIAQSEEPQQVKQQKLLKINIQLQQTNDQITEYQQLRDNKKETLSYFKNTIKNQQNKLKEIIIRMAEIQIFLSQ